jgi:hypothetical protein
MEKKRSAAVSLLSRTVIRTLIVLAIMIAIERNLFGQIKYYVAQRDSSMVTQCFLKHLNTEGKLREKMAPEDGLMLLGTTHKNVASDQMALKFPKENNISGAYIVKLNISLSVRSKRNSSRFHFSLTRPTGHG